MNKEEIEKITRFIENEIDPYDLAYDYNIEENTMQVIFDGHFTSNQEVELSFKVIDEDIHVHGLCESYILCDTREFWIELMGRI